eukprot:5475293-Pyramimonas_sp.AAC.1
MLDMDWNDGPAPVCAETRRADTQRKHKAKKAHVKQAKHDAQLSQSSASFSGAASIASRSSVEDKCEEMKRIIIGPPVAYHLPDPAAA